MTRRRFPDDKGSMALKSLERSGQRLHFHWEGFLKEISMKIAIPVLTAAAFVLLASPALAGQSTPKEREATRQLNIQAAQEAKNTNQQIAASASVAAQATAPAAAPTAPVESSPAAGQIQDQPASPAENSPANPVTAQ